MSVLFAYGTLMCEDIFQEVAGIIRQPLPAELVGYRRLKVSGEHYPAMIPTEGCCVQGAIYKEVTHSAWNKLDAFEGEFYIRKTVTVTLNNGQTRVAQAYIVHPDFQHQLLKEEWDFSEFLKKQKADFRQRYQGYLKTR